MNRKPKKIVIFFVIPTDFKGWEELREADQEKEQVEKELELVVEHHWHEGNEVILRVVDLIGRVPSWSALPIQLNAPLLFLTKECSI